MKEVYNHLFTYSLICLLLSKTLQIYTYTRLCFLQGVSGRRMREMRINHLPLRNFWLSSEIPVKKHTQTNKQTKTCQKLIMMQYCFIISIFFFILKFLYLFIQSIIHLTNKDYYCVSGTAEMQSLKHHIFLFKEEHSRDKISK